MKWCIYISILLACCLWGSVPAFAQSCFVDNVPPCPDCGGEGQTAVLTFAPGTNSCAIATFDCAPGTSPDCTVAGANSIKFIVGQVMTRLFVTVSANKATGNGVCASGDPNDPETMRFFPPPKIDCRFVRFFGDPAYNNEPPVGPNNSNTKVPFCYPYALDPLGQPTCVFYSVSGPDPGSTTYSNGVQFQIAWNDVVSTPPGYFHSPRMFDDPHKDHPTDLANASNCPAIDLGHDNVFPYESDQPEDNQFVCDITTFFSGKPNTVGTDPTSGGAGKSFNDFVVAWRFCKAKQDDVEGDGHEQGDDGHDGEFEFCQSSKKMEFDEPDTGRKMKGSMDAVTLSGNQAVISGAGTLGDGTPVNYTAVVLGNAPVVGANHFAISWITATGLAFQTSGALTDGFIAVPTLPPPPPL
jgi:hypothetical protein